MNANDNEIKKMQVILTNGGRKSNKLMTEMKKSCDNLLPADIKAIVTYQNRDLSGKFWVKDKSKFCHRNNLVYYGKCPYVTFSDNDVEKTYCRIEELIIDHNNRNKSSHILRHAPKMRHKPI